VALRNNVSHNVHSGNNRVSPFAFRVYRDASSVQNFPETLYEWTKVTDDSLREDRKYKMISTARFHGSSTRYKDSDRVVTRDVCVCAHAHRRENNLGK